MNQYFFKHKQNFPQKKIETSGSFGFKSSQFSQKKNNSINESVKKVDPSFFDQSSIRKVNQNQSGQFIYFKNDSILSQLKEELKTKTEKSQQQKLQQKKKKNSINYQQQISFQDTLQKSKKHQINQYSQMKDYGIGKSDLPPTLKKPKFGFKVSETAESSEIVKQSKSVEDQYQINKNQTLKQKKVSKVNQISKSSKTIIKSNDQSSLLILKNHLLKQDSLSSIKKPIQKPSVISKSISQSNSFHKSMNFKSIFKQKIQKASIINSSLSKKHKVVKKNISLKSFTSQKDSLSKHSINQKQIKIAQLKDLRELQNKLGELKHQNKKIIQYMMQKDDQIQNLKRKKELIESQDPYAVIKENQLMKAFLNKNKKQKKSSNVLISQSHKDFQNNLHSAKSIKQLSLKKSSLGSSLHDYQIKQYRFKVDPKQVTKTQKQFILSHRGLILSSENIDVGYSLKDKILTIYLTLKKQFEQVCVKLQQNSFQLSQNIDRVFKNHLMDKQIKFKTQIKSTKCLNPQDQFIPLCLKISVSGQEKFRSKLNQYKIDIPITIYNIVKQLQPTSNINLSEKQSRVSGKQIYKTQTLICCKELIKNPQSYLLKILPTGIYDKQGTTFHISFLWKQKRQNMRIRVKQRSFVIEGEGNPNKGSFQIIRSIVSLLIQQKNQK